MKPIISIIGLPGTPCGPTAARLNALTDQVEFTSTSKMREALMVAAGLWQGSLDEIVMDMMNAEMAPAFHVFLELPQGDCLRNLKDAGRKRDEYFAAKPIFDEWARTGEQVGQVFTVAPSKEGIGDEELLHMIGLFHEKLKADTDAFLASKHVEENPDLSEGETKCDTSSEHLQ